MTRLDAGKMNKDYIDPNKYEHCNGHMYSQVSSTGPSGQQSSNRSAQISLDMIEEVVRSRDIARVKSLLRGNDLPVNHEARGQLWTLLCCGSCDLAGDDETFLMYADKFNNVAPEKILPIHDMPEEMKAHHLLSSEGVKACHRVLYVISETHPHIIQFSPLLYAFTGVMLHYTTEQACFQCICELLKKRDVNHFLAPAEISLNAASFVLRDLAFRYAKTAALHIERSCATADGDLATFCNDWILWIFKCLPFHYLVRIMDCYLVEGYKVLFRVALTLIKLYHKVSGSRSSFIDPKKIDAGMRSMCTDIDSYTQCDRLLKEAFGIRGFSKKEIDSLFTKTEQALRRGGPGALATSSNRPSPAAGDVSAPSRGGRHSSARSKLMSIHSKKSFKLDKEIHTQLILDDTESDILDKMQLYRVWSWLPPAESVKEPTLVFTTNEHGYSLKTFYEKVEKSGPVLIIVRTMNDEVFGGYCSTDWIERHKYFDTGAQISYFGTGQSFVFSIGPEVVYPWVGKDSPVTASDASMFQAGDKSMLMIGGGDGCAIQIDKDLDHGSTSYCKTFNNDPLVKGEEFRIQCLEAFAFT